MLRRLARVSILVLLLTLAALAGSSAPALASAGAATRERTFQIGDVRVTTWNPVVITGLEYSTNLYFEAENTGDDSVTLHVPAARDVVTPPWVFHFFGFQDEELELGPGETRTVEYLITNEERGVAGRLKLPFRTDGAHAASRTLRLKIASDDSPGFMDLPADATVSGLVRTTDGEPIAGADVQVQVFSGRESFDTTTGVDGSYSVSVPSVETIRAAIGGRPLPYASLDYTVAVSADGYSYGFANEVAARLGASRVGDVVLSPLQRRDYALVETLESDYPHGFWWVEGNAGGSEFAAVQARHPPELHEPGEIVFFDAAGGVRWRHETPDECWGFDYVGDRIAAGCHDGTAMVLDEAGNLLWQTNSGQMNREIEIGPKGKKVFTGPWSDDLDQADVAMHDAGDGRVLWTWTGPQEWLRNSRFHPRGKWVVAGLARGYLVMLDRHGKELWTHRIGEFPMVLEMDKRGNVYAAGKNRELFSYDRNGKLRFRRRIANHVVTAGLSNMDRRGKRIALGTVGGMIYMFDQNGDLLWRRRLPEGNPNQGHNALQITANGRYVVVGGGGGTVALYDRAGSLLWDETFETGEVDDPINHGGVIAVTVTEDGDRIVAGFGDSVIRVFERR